MKKCKFCQSTLKLIGEIEPDTPNYSTKSPALGPYDGVEYFVIFFLLSCIITASLWSSFTFISVVVISIFSGFGIYLWQKSRKYYRCGNCGSEFYGNNLKIYKS